MEEIEFCVKIPRFSLRPRFVTLQENELSSEKFCEKGKFELIYFCICIDKQFVIFA